MSQKTIENDGSRVSLQQFNPVEYLFSIWKLSTFLLECLFFSQASLKHQSRKLPFNSLLLSSGCFYSNIQSSNACKIPDLGIHNEKIPKKE